MYAGEGKWERRFILAESISLRLDTGGILG